MEAKFNLKGLIFLISTKHFDKGVPLLLWYEGVCHNQYV